MKPQVKKILQKFSTQKVDLSILNKVKESTKDCERGIESLQMMHQEVKESIAKIDKEAKRLEAVERLAKKTYFQYREALEDLGFDNPDSMPEAKKLFNAAEDLVQKLNEVNKIKL
jgi:hypothetical protein